MTFPTPSVHAQPPVAPPKPAKFGALAWTAVILGIVGVVCSWVIFLNILTAIAASVGIVLGVIALFGTRRILAIIGVVLCVAAITFTVMATQAAVEILDGSTNQGQVVDAGQTPKQEAPAQNPTWGKRYSWANGLSVDVAAPTACTPGQYSVPQNIARAVRFEITITNGTSAAFETALMSIGTDAQFNGQKAEMVFDSSGGCDSTFDSATVLPGKTYTFHVAYSVGAQPGEMQLVFEPTFNSDKAAFVGQA
ncbi:hypothetical protein SAMN04488074_105364 [Lentzea albidocapillata subsp. violacea]|uniref:DUF4352 domain-containing protein n=1 Tax=Lentzea albidocapillata subsp. violacea TaxID=128104 RepID=A0A1G9BL87_9PSEU|nr:hypothetical protein [Lentzea albidocapillata]SDK40298.1 hypothetical protein SAMN04488074_105364 [Lentzea albidocapillata subsp. violacea]